ncbi:MAG: wax ester/triacylglycerol synthase family O-acyltransferase [Myxococcales bacterium]|nr:wax ester/triacylglycerol synthase family O-acyltransferase [Myxococcales bacterium]HIK84219.1 wax ester/triacylglycerol synthase family O-acyltransferase [Myxococcales bacterium]
MAQRHYDRLSAQDNSFLLLEQGNVRMHVASTNIFDVGPLQTEGGGIDIDLVKRATESYLHLVPRYRQRLHEIPLFNHAVWVDDPHFDLNYHVRHTALPKPGSLSQLKNLTARVMAQPLDRKRPLWETWIVEGLEGGEQFAMITKFHHCMIDGASGVDLANIQFSTSPEATPLSPPEPYRPRPAPRRLELFLNETRRQAEVPFEITRNFRRFATETENLRDELSMRANALTKLFGTGLRADETPLNGRVGPHRRFEWLSCRLDDLRSIRKGLGCSINDIVLTVVTGAVREYLIAKGIDVKVIDFKVSTPVSVRKEKAYGELGNDVSSWIIALPISLSNAKDQLDAIHEITEDLKATNQAIGVQMMTQIQEWTPSTLLSLGAQAMSGPINTIVTNVPGPQFPLYFHGARLRAIYPAVPLMEGMGLGIALTSYAGTMGIGFNTDPDIISDLELFIRRFEQALEGIAEAAGVTLGPISDDVNEVQATID